jgi:hypothetical protein
MGAKYSLMTYVADSDFLQAVLGLGEIARFQPDVTHAVAVPHFLSILQTTNATPSKADRLNLYAAIEAIALVAAQNGHYATVNRLLIDEFVKNLTDKSYSSSILAGLVQAVQLRQLSGSETNRKADLIDFVDLLSALHSKVVEVGDTSIGSVENKSFRCVKISVLSDGSQVKTKILDMIGKVTQAVVAWMTFEEQVSILPEAWRLFSTDEQTSGVYWGSASTLILSRYLLAGLYPEVNFFSNRDSV